MPARFLVRTISVLLIAFLLLSDVPPAASGQAPEPPKRMWLVEPEGELGSHLPGASSQAPGAVSPLAPDALADWSKIAFHEIFFL